MSTAKLIVPFRSVGFCTYLAIDPGGFCTCRPLSRSPQLCFICVIYSATGHGVRTQRSKICPNYQPTIIQISRDIRQISSRFEIDRPKVLKGARCSQSVSKASFPFRSSASEVPAKRPINAGTRGIRARQAPKVLRVRSSFGLAGETKFALKSVGRTDRAKIKRHGPNKVRC